MRLPVLTYHSILPRTEIKLIVSRTERIYTLEDSVFEQQMEYLKNNGYATINFDNIKDYLNSSTNLSSKSVILTFDDGRENNYHIAFPILRKYALKATFFIVTDFVGKKGYLNWDQVCEMSHAGMEIQSHTHTHCILSELADIEILEELSLSKKILEEKIKKRIDVLALPHGRGDNRHVKKAALSANYLFVCTSNWGGNNIRKNSFYLNRLSVKLGSDMMQFQSFIELRKLPLFLKKVKNAPVKLIKMALGKKNYDKLRRVVIERLYI